MDQLPDEVSQLEQRALLYAAGELPPDEAVEFERAVSGSGQAAAALEGARRLLAETASGLERLQEAEAVSARSMRRARDRAVRAVLSWVTLEREARSLRSAHRHPLSEGVVWRFARWPLAAAALLVVGLVIWTFSTNPVQNLADGGTAETTPTQGTPSTNSTTDSEMDQVAALFDNPSRDGSELGAGLAGGLSDDLAALRLLEEPDYE